MTRPDSEGQRAAPPGRSRRRRWRTGRARSGCASSAGDRRERVTLHERRELRMRLRRRLERARGAGSSSTTSSRACAPASGSRTRRTAARVDRLRARADLPRVRVLVAAGEDRGRDRRQADRRQHAGRLPLAADASPAAVLRATTGSTRSTASCACASRRTSCARPRSCARAIAAGAELRDRRGRRIAPLGLASIRS